MVRLQRNDLISGAVLLAAFALSVWLYADRAPADPDQHFHFALARLWSEHGLPRVIPQVEGIGWNTRFVDKEFLFHLITWLGWLAGERAGVIGVVALLGAGVVLGCFVLARKFLDSFPAALVTAAVVSCPVFLFRLAILRPHVLAIGAVLLLLFGLVRGSWKLTLVGGLAFALGYHALYVPLAVLGLAFVLLGRAAWRDVGAGFAGLVVGTVLNPYFPATLETTWMTLTIAATKPLGNTFGEELLPLKPMELLGAYRVPFGLLLGSLWLTVRSRAREGFRHRLFLTGLAALFWVLCLRSARASEYAIPFTGVAFASVAAFVPGRWLSAALALMVLSNVPLVLESAKLTELDRYTLRIVDAVEALPKEAAGQKVLNCSFAEGEVMLDLRPDVRFVDVLDPTFLERFDRERHLARRSLIEGTERNLAQLVRDVFGARYVMCGFLPARRLLDDDPAFVRLRPPPGPPLPLGSGPSLYLLKD